MASLRVLAFDHEGTPVQFDTWLDDLQLYLLSDIKDGVPPPMPLLLLQTFLLLRTSGLLLLVQSAATARERVARVVEVAAAVVEVVAGVVVGAAVEVVAAVGLVEGVGALVVAVEAAVGVAAVGLVAVGQALGVLVLEVASVSSNSVGARPSRPNSFTCGRLHTQHRCFSRLDDAWRAEFGDVVELPRWADLLRSRIAIFDLDFDAILSAMYDLSVSAEGDSYRCIAAAALDASEPGTLPGTAPAQALHTFTLDSGASACFFHDSITLTPLSTPVPVRLADPSGGLFVARSSTVLPCPTVPSGSLSGLHLPSFSANLVSTAALQDAMVTTTTPGGQRVTICTCTRTGRHLATFTHRPGSSLYTLATEPPQVAASAQVSASGLVAASCLCRLLSHQTLLWHHRLGHPSLPRLRGMHSCLLVSGLPRSLPPLPPSPAQPCLFCFEGRQRAAPHSSSFPPTTAPLQTLQMEVWGPARVSEQSRERYFLLVADDYTRYTTVFPLCNKGEVSDVLIPWIRTVRLQLRERFGQDLLVLHLHSDRGGEFSSNLLWNFVVGRAFSSPQPLAPCLLARDLPTLCWTGHVGDASVFRFYHPTSRRVCPSQDVTFDESDPFYHLFPYHSAPPPPPPLYLAPSPPPVDPFPPQGPAPSGAASGGATSGGAEPGGAESEGVGTGGAEPGGFGDSAGASPRLSPQQLREWFDRHARLRSGATGAGGAGVAAGAGVPGGTAATDPGGARTR
ncbi:unnamed protein product, partial [Closterium sp. NIES-54]